MQDAIKAVANAQKAIGKLKSEDFVDGESAQLGAVEVIRDLHTHLQRQDVESQPAASDDETNNEDKE